MCPSRQGQSQSLAGRNLWAIAHEIMLYAHAICSWWIVHFMLGTTVLFQSIHCSWCATETFPNHVLTRNIILWAYHILQTLPHRLRQSTVNFILLLSLNLAMPSKEAKFHHEQTWEGSTSYWAPSLIPSWPWASSKKPVPCRTQTVGIIGSRAHQILSASKPVGHINPECHFSSMSSGAILALIHRTKLEYVLPAEESWECMH